MKTCFKCGLTKSRTEFYAHPKMADGLLGKCKECTKRDTRTWARRSEYDRYRAMLPHRVNARKEYLLTEAGMRARQRALRKQKALHPDKYRARTAVGNAIRHGLITRQPCSVCGSPKSEAHHEDYSKPFEVQWLCNAHHRAAHKEKAA